MKRPDNHRHLAYLTSQYPALSHTFIRREIRALRDEGWIIDAFSIRPGSYSSDDEVTSEEAARTFVIMTRRAHVFAAAHASWLLTHPLRYFRAIGLAARHRVPGFRAAMLGAAHFLEAGLLARELKRRRIDHLHNHFANSAATVGMIAAELVAIPWSFTMHGVSETDYPAGVLLGRKIKAADFVVCASWFMQAQGFRTVGVDQWHKFHVVRCGVETRSLPARRQSGETARIVICVGRLSPEKGHAGLLRAFASLERARDIQLYLVGDGPSQRDLERLGRELLISDRVHFLGSMSEAATLAEIARADLLVLPSLLEGLPLVLIEAMAVGVPVVAPRVAGIPELVHDGRNGLLFTPSNWTELAERMSRLLDDPALCVRIAAGARRTIASEFDIRSGAAKLSQLFGSVPYKRPRRRGRPLALSFGLREAIVFSTLAMLIAVAIALRSGSSSPRPQPLAGSAAAGER